eukprot:TRINITY_DN644_c0_g2_i1.p1 TRINITY_DN644_c0_g2~~TRINITY_DN644_c0_g2_i1.p1  ORF type:complete len:238 (-),score=43.44 TRINITY_DN644_c0_g2_i1:391-1104(-)
MVLLCPVGLDVADEPAAWRAAGFDLDPENKIQLGDICIRVVGRQEHPKGGIVAWRWSALEQTDPIPGIPTIFQPDAPFSSAPHRNGAMGVDHIVLFSPDWQQSVLDLRSVGLEPLRETNSVRRGVTQVIYRPKNTIIELVGPRKPPEHPTLKGLTLVTSDVDTTHQFFGEYVKPPWDAVQPGRRMTVLKNFPGISIAVAFMSPHVREVVKGEAREKLYQQRARAQEAELSRRADSKL